MHRYFPKRFRRLSLEKAGFSVNSRKSRIHPDDQQKTDEMAPKLLAKYKPKLKLLVTFVLFFSRIEKMDIHLIEPTFRPVCYVKTLYKRRVICILPCNRSDLIADTIYLTEGSAAFRVALSKFRYLSYNGRIFKVLCFFHR